MNIYNKEHSQLQNQKNVDTVKDLKAETQPVTLPVLGKFKKQVFESGC